jgi:hypothetical protein
MVEVRVEDVVEGFPDRGSRIGFGVVGLVHGKSSRFGTERVRERVSRVGMIGGGRPWPSTSVGRWEKRVLPNRTLGSL